MRAVLLAALMMISAPATAQIVTSADIATSLYSVLNT